MQVNKVEVNFAKKVPTGRFATDLVGISMTLENVGTLPVTGTAVIAVETADGVLVGSPFSDTVAGLAPGGSLEFQTDWDTTGVELGDYRVIGYLLYGELNFADAENAFVFVHRRPYLKVQTDRCSWNTIWTERDMLAYGRLYCQEIDTAILRGYNADFDFEVGGTMTGGAPCCTFHYRSEGLGIRNMLRYAIGKRRVGSRAIQPWDYHAGHLYKTLKETLVAELGEAGEQAVAAALQTFGQAYGEEMAQAVRSFEDTDFNQIS